MVANVHAPAASGAIGGGGPAFWRLLLVLLRPYRVLLAVTVASGILNQGTLLAGAALGAYLVGAAATGASVADLQPGLIALGALVVLHATLEWAEMWLAHELAFRILADIRGRLYWALERLAPAYLLERRSGDVAAATMADVEVLEWFYAHTFGQFIVAVVVPALALAVLAAMDPLLPLVVLPWLLLLATVPTWLGRRAARQGQRVRDQLGEVNAEVVDGVQGLREVVLAGQGPRQLARLGLHSADLIRTQMRFGMRLGFEHSATNLLVGAGILSALAASAWLASDGRLPAALFPVAVVLAAGSFEPVVAATAMGGNLGMIAAAARRVFQILERHPEVHDRVGAPPAGPLEPRVEFRGVRFRYGPTLPDALHEVSFAVAPGETVALVGHSGAGKSTCAHLLLRFWDAQAGAITIGGHDIRDFPQAALRDLISPVPQDIYLFNASIRDNIRLGRPEATDAEVEAAARAALAHDFIAALPQGYETNAGERGVQMSGGQRQRIAIARALLKDAPILVLDEAVSSLDAESEQALQQAMARVRVGRTILVIAHRLSTIRSADRIVVLERGRVVESGTHAALLARDGAYSRLIASQRGGVVSS